VIGDFPAAAGRLSIARKAELEDVNVKFGHGERGSAGPAVRPCGFSSGVGPCHAAKGESGGRAAGLESEPCATSPCGTSHRRDKARSANRRAVAKS